MRGPGSSVLGSHRGRAAMVSSIGIAVAVLLSGCGAHTSTAAAPGSAGSSAAAASSQASAGAGAGGGAGAAGKGSSIAPATVQTVSGTKLTVPGNKPALLYFFTASCSSCAAGATTVGAGVRKAGAGVQAIAVDLDPGEPVQVIHDFMRSVGNPPLSVVRDDGTLLKRFNVDALGLTVVLNKTGRVVYRGVDPTAAQTAAAIAAAGT